MSTLAFDSSTLPPLAVCVFFEELEIDNGFTTCVKFPGDIDEAYNSEARLCVGRLGGIPEWFTLPRTSQSEWLSAFVYEATDKIKMGDTIYSPHFNALLGSAINIHVLKTGAAPSLGRMAPVDMVMSFYGPAFLTFVRRTTFNCQTAADWLGYKPADKPKENQPWSLQSQSQFMMALMQALHSRSFEVPHV